MKFYPFHIGDYRGATMHLSNEEDLAYRRALDWYYDTEKAIPLDTQWVSRRLRVAEKDLETVLNDFFVRTEAGWIHERCDQEIAAYAALAARNRENGKRGGRPKGSGKPNGNPAGSGPKPGDNPQEPGSPPLETQTNPNQEPRTINQEPNTPPSPRVGGGEGGDAYLPEPHELAKNTSLGGHALAGAVCLTMKRLGIPDVNPGHPKLLALLNGGATVGAFEAAARSALKSQKGFAYALAIVEREEREARDLDAVMARERHGVDPNAPVETYAQKAARQRMEEISPLAARKSPEARQAFAKAQAFMNGTVIDITPQPKQIGS